MTLQGLPKISRKIYLIYERIYIFPLTYPLLVCRVAIWQYTGKKASGSASSTSTHEHEREDDNGTGTGGRGSGEGEGEGVSRRRRGRGGFTG